MPPDTRNRDSLLRRLWRRWRDRHCARVILVDENGHRMEYVHIPEDPKAWRREGENAISGYLALEHLTETFIEARTIGDRRRRA